MTHQSSFIGEVIRDQTKFASKLPEGSLMICTKRLRLCQHLLILLLRIFSGNCKQRISRFSTITLNWDFTENLLVSTKKFAVCLQCIWYSQRQSISWSWLSLDTVLKSLVFFTKSWNRKVDVVFYTYIDWLGVKVDTFSKL